MRGCFPSLGNLRAYPIAAAALPMTFAIGGAVWACADSTCRPGWHLGVAAYDCAGEAMLAPGNDTRINMLWLMRSLTAMPAREAPAADANDPQFGQTFLSWSGLRAALWPAPTVETPAAAATPASSCETYADTVPAFEAALAAEPGVAPAERGTLNQLRAKVGCGPVSWDDTTVKSRAGREYLAYLKAAQAFHANDWAGAQQGFAALRTAKSRWVAETAVYMPIRIALRTAVANAIDQYGDFAGLDHIDAKAVASARDAIAKYLKSYPKGRYAESAKGLTRRVAWLSGDNDGLAHTYEKLLATTSGDHEESADLAEEIDLKLLEDTNASAVLAKIKDAPLLLAIADLKRMRQDDDAATPGLSATDLAAQKAQFAGRPNLYDFLEASRAYYAGEAPSRILALLPDEARSTSFTPLAFSRQALRGMALAKAGDPNEAGFWRDLTIGASPFYQRPLVQMGLAIRWQRDGKVAQAFASGSPVTDSMTREILLQTVATPAIVRDGARDASRPPRERNIARFTLLYKDLANGAFADFGGDLTLVPSTANSKANLWNFSQQDEIPVGLFRSGKWSDGSLACGPLARTAAALAQSAKDRRAQLCLGEFYRLNGFDGFGLFRADPRQDILGAGPDGFPGKALSRSDLYAAVIADQWAMPDERAYALYRAVMCYAPSRINGCTAPSMTIAESNAAQVPASVRKGWFTELKQRYPNSRWAKTLIYYW